MTTRADCETQVGVRLNSNINHVLLCWFDACDWILLSPVIAVRQKPFTNAARGVRQFHLSFYPQLRNIVANLLLVDLLSMEKKEKRENTATKRSQRKLERKKLRLMPLVSNASLSRPKRRRKLPSLRRKKLRQRQKNLPARRRLRDRTRLANSPTRLKSKWRRSSTLTTSEEA